VHRLAELVRIFVSDDAAFAVEQGALAVALVYRTEIPAVAVIVGKLRVLEDGVERRHILQEFGVAPLAADGRLFRIAVENGAGFAVSRIFLLLRPHVRGVGLVVPHRVAVIAVHENVGLVHVTGHALRRRYRPRERVPDRVAGFVARDGGVDGLCFAVVAGRGIDAAVFRVAVVGVDGMAGGAAGGAVVTGLLIGAEEPQVRIVEPGLGDVDQWHGDAVAGAGATVGLLDVRAAGLVQALQQAGDIGQADFRKNAVDDAAAAFKHAEHVGGWRGFPGGQRRQLWQQAFSVISGVGLTGASSVAGWLSAV